LLYFLRLIQFQKNKKYIKKFNIEKIYLKQYKNILKIFFYIILIYIYLNNNNYLQIHYYLFIIIPVVLFEQYKILHYNKHLQYLEVH